MKDGDPVDDEVVHVEGDWAIWPTCPSCGREGRLCCSTVYNPNMGALSIAQVKATMISSESYKNARIHRARAVLLGAFIDTDTPFLTITLNQEEPMTK